MGQATDITELLVALGEGKEAARTRLAEAVYDELRRLARGFLRRERPDHSVPPTALVHDVFLKVIDQRRVHWRNRAQFFAIAAHAPDPGRPRPGPPRPQTRRRCQDAALGRRSGL